MKVSEASDPLPRCTWDTLTASEQFQTLDVMTYYGGGFCKGLAKLIRIADSGNTRILVEAFDHLIETYQPKNWRS